MIVSRIAHVALGVPDVDLASEFYREILGLDVVGREGRHVYLGTGTSTAFEVELGSYGEGLDHVAFGVCSVEALELARVQLEGSGAAAMNIDVVEEPGLSAAIGFALPSGHWMELVVEANPRGFISAAEVPARHHRATGPAPLEHITLMSVDIQADAKFLVDNLGFRITDSWQPPGESWRNTWLRAGEHHHDIALLAANGSAPELHHFCFAVPAVADLVRVADALAARGMRADASIGRHLAGNNVFLYFKDPFGNRVEVNTDMARIDPAAAPRILREPPAFDAWREGRPPALIAGSPCRDARAAVVK